MKAALSTDCIIGVFWCNPVDTPKGFGNPGVKQGFFGDELTERPGLHQAVKELNAYRDKMTPAGIDTEGPAVNREPGKAPPAEDKPQINAWVASLLKELDLTEEQKPKFLAIQRSMTAKWAEFQKIPAEERKAAQTTFYKARNEELKELLSPEQFEKFREFRANRSQKQ